MVLLVSLFPSEKHFCDVYFYACQGVWEFHIAPMFLICFCFTHMSHGRKWCPSLTSLMCDSLDLREMVWWMPHLCGRYDKLFLSSSDETHILWHKFFFLNKIFYTMIKYFFMLYKQFFRPESLESKRNKSENLCQTMINFYTTFFSGGRFWKHFLKAYSVRKTNELLKFFSPF